MSQHQLDRALERGDDIGERREDIRRLFDYSMSSQESIVPDPPPELHHVVDPNLEASQEDLEEVVAEKKTDDEVDEYNQLLHYVSSQESVVEVTSHVHKPAQLPSSQAQDFIDVFDSPQPGIDNAQQEQDQEEDDARAPAPARQYVPGWHAEAGFQLQAANLRRLLDAKYPDRGEHYICLKACRGVLDFRWQQFLVRIDQLAQVVDADGCRLIFTVGVFYGTQQQVPIVDCDKRTEFFLSSYKRINVYEVFTLLGYDDPLNVEADYDVVFCMELLSEKQMHTMLNNWMNDTSKPPYSAFGIPYLEIEADALETYKELITEGKVPWRMASHVHRPTYRRNTAILEKLCREVRNTASHRPPVTVYLMTGPPGSGKSSFALDVLTGGDPRQAYWAQRGDYQEGYTTQRVFVLDECSHFYSLGLQGTSSSPFRIENLKEMTSSTCRFTINKKFGSQPFTSEIIAIISNYQPEEWNLTEKHLEQLLDRVHFKMQFDVTVLSPTRKLYTYDWTKGNGFTRTLNHDPIPPPPPGDWTKLYLKCQQKSELRKQVQLEKNTIHHYAHLHARPHEDRERRCEQIVDHDQEEEARTQRSTPRTPVNSQRSTPDNTSLTPHLTKHSLHTPIRVTASKRSALRNDGPAVKREFVSTEATVGDEDSDYNGNIDVKSETSDSALPPITPTSWNCGHLLEHFDNVPTDSAFFPGKKYVELSTLGLTKKNLKVGDHLLLLMKDTALKMAWREARVRSKGVRGGAKLEFAQWVENGQVCWYQFSQRHGCMPSCTHPFIYIASPTPDPQQPCCSKNLTP